LRGFSKKSAARDAAWIFQIALDGR